MTIFLKSVSWFDIEFQACYSKMENFEQVIQDGNFTCMKFEYKSLKNDKMKKIHSPAW